MDFTELCQKLPHMQTLKVKFEWGGGIFRPLSYNFRHKTNIFISEQPKTKVRLILLSNAKVILFKHLSLNA